MAGRQLAITKKFSLSDAAEGWDDCYLLYSNVSYGELADLAQLNTDIGEAEGVKLVLEFVRSHVISGKIRVLDEAGQSVASELLASDVDQLPPNVINDLFKHMTGAQFEDPKVSRQAAVSEVQPNTPENPTETSSSTN